MYSAKAKAYTNIALIKYWGKENEALILPKNNSLSLTLDAFYTETAVTFSEDYSTDSFLLDGIEQTKNNLAKISAFLDLVRRQAGISFFARVESQNFVPTAAGLASSASGLAALATACDAALQLNLSKPELSRLARRGSGSACRSIYGGFAEWLTGDDQTSYAVPVSSGQWENSLSMIFILIDAQKKAISSRDGMKKTVETSSFYPGWLETVPTDLINLKTAIKEQDFQKLGETMEANGLKMHGTTLAAVPPFTYWQPQSLLAMQAVQALRQQGLACYFTMDAGPNVKVLCQKKDETAILAYLEKTFAKEQLIVSHAGKACEVIS